MKKKALFLICAVSLAGCDNKHSLPVPSHETCYPMATRYSNAAKFPDDESRNVFLKACAVSDVSKSLKDEMSAPPAPPLPLASHETCYPMKVRMQFEAKFPDAESRNRFDTACRVLGTSDALQNEISSGSHTY